MKRYFLLLCFWWLWAPALAGDGSRGDSLLLVLASMPEPERLRTIDSVAWDWAESDPAGGLVLSQAQLELAGLLNDEAQRANAYGNLAGAYWTRGEYERAIEHYTHGIAIRGKLGDRKGVANYLNNIAILYRNLGNYPNALSTYFEAIKMYESMGEEGRVLGNALNNVGVVYKVMGNMAEARAYYQKALDIFRKESYAQGMGHSLDNIGTSYNTEQDYRQAVPYFEQALHLADSMQYMRLKGNVLLNMSSAYMGLGDNSRALSYAEQAQQVYEAAGHTTHLPNALIVKAKIYLSMKLYGPCMQHAEQAHGLSRRLGALTEVRDACQILSQVYSARGLFEQAYGYQLELQQVQDSLVNADIAKQTSNLRQNHELEKQQLRIEALEKERSLERLLRYGFVGVLLLLLAMLGLLFGRYRLKKQANQVLSEKNTEILQQKEEIETQRDHIEAQRDEIEAQSVALQATHQQVEEALHRLTDSINYALRIQRAMLGKASRISSRFSDAFLLLKPKDVVSGDFYWFYEFPPQDAQYPGLQVLVVADCTGHGVPGAMVTVIGNTLLNEVVKVNRIADPASILHELDRKIQVMLNQDAPEGQQDGMDITVLCLDSTRKSAQFAGAKNDLLLVRQGQAERIKGSRYSVGGSYANFGKKYESIALELRPNDRLYMYSDGYQDQFGGVPEGKFMSKRFREYLASISHLPMLTQHEMLDRQFEEWRGPLPQTDDVLVVGLRI